MYGVTPCASQSQRGGSARAYMLFDGTTLRVFLIALSAMAKVAIISMVGVAMSIYPKDKPLLTPELNKGISAAVSLVFVPALVVNSLGSSVTLELLERFGVLIALCLLIIIISYASTYLMKFWVPEGNDKLFTAVLVAVGSPNAVSMPLIVMKAICEDSTVNSDYENDAAICFNEASSMLFIYQIGWHIVFWSCGYPLLKTLDESNPTTYNWREQIVWNLLFSPCMIAIYVGIIIALIPYLQDWFFYEFTPLRPVGSSIQTLGEPVVCINTLIMSASLAQVYIKLKAQSSQNKEEVIDGEVTTRKKYGVADNKNDMDGIVEICECNIAHEVTSHSDVDGTELTSGYTLTREDDILSESPSISEKKAATVNLNFELPHWRITSIMLLFRLMIPSALMLLVMIGCVEVNLVPRDERLMRVLIIIEAAAPSAQLVIVSLNQVNNQSIASSIAYMYIFQYTVSIFTMTLWGTIGMRMIYA